MNVLKKIFNVSVTFTTVLWSLGVSAFVPAVAVAASCPALNPGDMIKVTGKAAIFVLNNDKKVLYFPSGDEFKSFRATYGGYISINQDCYDSLSVPSTYPGGVNFAPGSYIVKRASSDQLYVVEPGNTLAKIDTAAAKALYGSNYKVMTIADQFWPNYVNRGSDISGSGAQVHPGMLVMNGGKTWYVDKDMKLWMVSAAGMTANGFQSKFVHSVSDSAVAGLAQGGTLDTEVKAITDKTQSGGVVATAPGTPTTVVSGSTTVTLAADNPFSATIISDSTNGAQAQIKVLKLVFWAGNDGDSIVTSLKLTRGGVSADTDISNMYLYDGDNMVAGNPSVANGKITFTSNSGLFTVARGSSKTIEVRLDLKNAVTAGKTISFSLASNSDVTTSGNATVGGSYPLAGNAFTVAQTSADLGKLAFTSVTPSAAGTVDPGTTGFEIWRFQVANTAQDMELRKLNFTIVGSVNVGDLTNFSLWDGATQIGSTVAAMSSGKTVTFDFTASPYVVTKGQTKILSLKADVVAGTNRSFYASLQNAADLITFDKNYQVFVKANGTDSFSIVQPNNGSSAVSWSINTGSLTQLLDAASPTGNIAVNATNVTLAKFNWKANGEDVKISSLNVSSTISGGRTITNVRLLVNGSQVGTTIATLAGNSASNNGWGTFGNSFIVKAGTSSVVTIVADLTGSATAGDTVIAGVVAGSSNGQGVVSLTNISTTGKNANTLTVKSGTVSVAKNGSFGEKSANNPTGTVNGTQQKVGSFVITAGAGEDVTLSQITLEDYQASAGNCAGNTLQNITLMDAGKKVLGQTYANPSTTCTTRNTFTFNLSPAVTIANGAQYTVDVYADLKAAYTSAAALLDVYSITASGKTTGSNASVTPSAQTVPLQAVYVSTAGALMVQVDSDTPIATNYLMGATDQTVARFKVTASSTEDVNVTQLVISAKFSSGATGTMSNIRLFDELGNQVGSAVSSFSDSVAGTSSPTTTYSHATFTNLPLKVLAGSSKTLSLKVDFTSYQNAGFSTTGQNFAPVILQNYFTAGSTNPVTATGGSSGTSLTATVSTYGSVNNFGASGTGAAGAYSATTTLYRAKLTTAWASDAPSGASAPGASQIVGKFVITNLANSGNYTATVQNVNFDLSSTISNTATRVLTVYKDAVNTTAVATTNGADSAGTGAFYDTNISEANFTDVDISSGASKTFFVTLDTTNAAQAKSLSVRIGNADITWTDGVSSVTVMGQDLPLAYKTFTY